MCESYSNAAKYCLDECLEWIIENRFKKIALQLKQTHLEDSVQISDFLRLKYHQTKNETLDIYLSQTNTCCVDLLVTQHVSNIDAIVHIGQVCLSRPNIKNDSKPLPVLFVYERHSLDSDNFSKNFSLIYETIENLVKSEENCRICILYDSNLIEYANAVEQLLVNQPQQSIQIANLYCPESNWTTTPIFRNRFKRDKDGQMFGPYILENRIQDYDCAVYIGDKLPITLALECPSNLTKFTFSDGDMKVEKPNTSKLLNRRIALVSRLKEEQELKFGVIITNPLPDLSSTIERLKTYTKRRKHTLYLISMIQTVDECKIGNFDLCDAFVVVNSCSCSTILESLVFNRPILTELELKLACGFEVEYGRVVWPSSSPHLWDEDLVNKRKASDVSLALIQTRNELLERCSQARTNMWSGLDYEKSGGTGESLNIEEGLKGIASSYVSEPLKASNQNKKCCGVEVKMCEGGVGKIGATEASSDGSTTSTSNLVGESAKLLMRINDYDDGKGGGGGGGVER